MIGALVLRGVFVALGAELLERYDFVIYIFGVLLVVTGIRMAIQRDHEIDPEKSFVLRAVRRLIPVTERLREGRFLMRPADLPEESMRPEGRGRSWAAGSRRPTESRRGYVTSAANAPRQNLRSRNFFGLIRADLAVDRLRRRGRFLPFPRPLRLPPRARTRSTSSEVALGERASGSRSVSASD